MTNSRDAGRLLIQMSSRTIRYAPRAQRDIRSVQAYTSDAWGPRQARSYVRNLRSAISALKTFPDRGLVYGEPESRMRRIIIQSHVVYYLVDESTIEVVRILHQRMDAAAHLE